VVVVALISRVRSIDLHLRLNGLVSAASPSQMTCRSAPFPFNVIGNQCLTLHSSTGYPVPKSGGSARKDHDRLSVDVNTA
jgi:hypothetical protein